LVLPTGEMRALLEGDEVSQEVLVRRADVLERVAVFNHICDKTPIFKKGGDGHRR